MMWDKKNAKISIGRLLEELENLEDLVPPDHSGNTVHISIAILYILDHIRKETFYGTINLKIKGLRVISPEILSQTEKLEDIYAEYLKTKRSIKQ